MHKRNPADEPIAGSEQVTLDLLQADDSVMRISRLDYKNMEIISQIQRQRISNRGSAREIPDFKQYENSIKMNQQEMDLLQLNLMIDSLLEKLVNTKIQLIQLQEPYLIKENQKTKAFIPYFFEQLKKYNKTLLLRQSQLGSLVYVMEKKNDVTFKQKYLSAYKQIINFVISPDDAKKPINTVILQEAFQTQTQFLEQYMDMITLLKLNIVHKKYLHDIQSLIRTANKLKIINSKIITIAQIFPYACVLDKNDLFSFKKTSERWHKLLSTAIMHKIYGEKQKIKNTFMTLKNGLNIVNATMSIMHKTKEGWNGTANGIKQDFTNLAISTSKILKCLIFKQDAHHQAEMLISEPDGALAKQIWNLPEQKMFRNLISTVLPSIAFSQQFWIPRLFQQFLQKDGKINLPPMAITDMATYRKELYIQRQHNHRVQMRINSPYILSFREQKNSSIIQAEKQKQKSKNLFFDLIIKTINHSKQESPTGATAVVFHIHGGGFISMSSFIHQTYTRVWANNLKVPIISVDYGKAPELPFPTGLYDCFEAYMWTLYCYRQVFNAEPHRVVLVGDSAGGNLVAALTNMLINLKMRAPDGIVLVYPALNLNYNNYTPSLLTSLTDMILPHTFLKICLKAYLPEGTNPLSQYVSPMMAKDQVLKRYPPTRIFVGSKDPFHDDCCRFTQRLNKFDQQKAKLLIFDEFPHGFLQFDIKTQPHEQSRKATKQVEMAIAELLRY